jgi:hypothetical protein
LNFRISLGGESGDGSGEQKIQPFEQAAEIAAGGQHGADVAAGLAGELRPKAPLGPFPA